MAAPSFVEAGIGTTDAGGAWASGFVSAAGNVVIFQVLQDGATSGAVARTTATNCSALDGTANSATFIGSFDVGSPTAGIQHLWIARATGAAQIGGTNSTSEDLYTRAYEFTDVSTGTTLAEVIENGTAGNAVNGAGTGTTVSDTGVTTLGADRLALQLVAMNDDIAIDAFAGETGGDWAEAVAEYAESSGTDGMVQLQTATAYTTAHTALSASSSQVYGASGTTEEVAQSFASPGACTLTQIAFLLEKGGTPTDDLIIEVQTDSGGVPSGTVVGTGATIPAATVPASGWYNASVSVTLSASTTYWLVARRSGARSTVNYYQVRQSSASYGSGQAVIRDSGTWTGQAFDFAFGLGTSLGGTIDGGSDSVVSAGWGVVGFALIGTTSITPETLPPQHVGVDFGAMGVLAKARDAWERTKGGIFVPRLWTPKGETI